MTLSPKQLDEHDFDVPDLLDTIRAAWKDLDDLRSQYETALLIERKLMLAKYDELQARLDAANQQLSDPVVSRILRRKELGG